MAFAQSAEFQRPSSQPSIDRKPTFYSDDLGSPEESFMESNMIPAHDDRRDSYGNTIGPVFSPQSWEDFPAPPVMHEPQFVQRTNPFLPQGNNPFLRHDPTPFTAQSDSQWHTYDHNQDPRGPAVTATYEPYNPEYEQHSAPGFNAGPFGPMQNNVRPSAVFPTAPTPVPISASPTPVQDWMNAPEQGHVDARIPKRLRGQSPGRYAPGFRGGDGIRKKNARFDIPQERNLHNIDRLIEEANGDDEVKELKQQKRLLRNRQAALDSRQRKKQRAEELEVDNKLLRDQISQLTEELSIFRLRSDSAHQAKDHLLRENAQLKEHVQAADYDKENLVVEHTRETGELRKKIQVLQEIVELRDSSDLSRNGSGNFDYPITHEMSGLSVDSLDMGWSDPFTDFLMGDEMSPEDIKPLQTSTLVLAPKKKIEEEKEDQSGPSGLLMLLLLCGAWVASKASTSSAINLPRMPEEVRSDAALVFDDLMKDHGVATFQAIGAFEPTLSSTHDVQQMPFQMAGASSSTTRLDNMHSHLTKASKRQEAESAFSLSAKQYQSLTSTELPEQPYHTPPEDDSGHRRHLVDTLKSMREDAKGHSPASVYTRSLLWERIPNDVVQQFKRMADQTSSRAASVDCDAD